MKLDDYCIVKYGLSEADFWIHARGSEKSLGQPTKDSENIAKKIGIKVKEDSLNVLDPGYLYYVFMHLHNTQFWQKMVWYMAL